MEERLIVIITEWSDYKGFFFLFFEFTCIFQICYNE